MVSDRTTITGGVGKWSWPHSTPAAELLLKLRRRAEFWANQNATKEVKRKKGFVEP